MPTLAQLRATTAERVLPVLQKCQPAMLHYELACTSEVVDAVLFMKDVFVAEQARLRVLLAGRRPNGTAERIAWIKQVTTRVELALNATNIIPTWIVGGDAPVNVPNEASSNDPIKTLESSLWPNANSYVTGLTVQVAQQRASNGAQFSLLHWPLSQWKHFDPYRGQFAAVDTWGYNTITRSALKLFHNPRDYRANQPADNPPGFSGLRGIARNVGVSMRGLGFMEATGASALDRPGDAALITQQVRDALRVRGVDINDVRDLRPRPNTIFDRHYPVSKFDAIFAQHFTSHPGANLVIGWQSDGRGGPRSHGLLPGAAAIVEYYAAIAKDIVETPYESFVLTGIQRWARNWEQWAARGLINKSATEMRDIAQTAASVKARIITAGAFSLAATVATLANPIAGVIAQALGAILDLALSESAVGYWNCPYPLTRRSALGDCDFGQVLGQEALARAQRQQQGIPGYIAANAAPPPSATANVSGGVPPWMFLAGGVALVAGLGYYFLKE